MEDREIKAGVGWKKAGACLCAFAILAVGFTAVYPRLGGGLGTAEKAGVSTPESVTQVAKAAPDPIGQFRQEREQVRDKEVAQLTAIMEDASSSQQIRDQAATQMLALTGFMEQEVTLEGVLRARGFDQVLCTVHAESVNILVRAASLTRAQSATILELALRETGQQSGNIKIIPVS